ncbi:MAG: MBL fold metallo-hydrolase [Clostridiales bacterium]|jgi:ribonuclease J|nr:MBL fold metallo-hydrolase [Clostridiales bacterium]
MNVTVHRGARQIGGCVTEIASDECRVFVDIGENLPGTGCPLPPIEGLTAGDGSKSALFLTHYHGDHIGRLDKVLPDIPVYIGETAKSILLNLAERIYRDRLEMYERLMTFKPFKRIYAGDISALPVPCDHSALDAFMFLIEAKGLRILHTGDFRLHGSKGRLTLELSLPMLGDIDYMVCEGTVLSRDGQPPMSEHDLLVKANKMMAEKPYVFVLCSSTNIERIAAFYHANPKGRMFICDSYQKKQLEAVGERHNFNRVYDYAPNLDSHMKDKGFCMLVRQGEFFRRVMEKFMGENAENCLVIYSMWTGYLDREAGNQGLIDFLKPYRYRVLHTSGHASAEDIKRLYELVRPKRGLIPIHTDAPQRFAEIVPESKLVLLNDGEVLNLNDK